MIPLSHLGRSLPAAALCLALLLSGCRERQTETRIPISVRDARVRPPVEKPAKELVATQEAFIEVSEKVTPAVVHIQAARSGQLPGFMPMSGSPFGELFAEEVQPRRRAQSMGSGFLITTDGYILTNEHVVKGAEEIKVKLSDNREYVGRLVGADPRTDVAVLKIESEDPLPVTVLGDSDNLKVGQWALAIGNPFGLDRTLTVGVISATGRNDINIKDFEDFIQTDASINPGNSGGPLLNIFGEVIGINTAIVAAGQGIGFAIPINLARVIANQLIERGEVIRGWLGVTLQNLTPDLARSFGLDRATGALVIQVAPESPAARAGLQRGDVLLSFNGKALRNVRDLQLLVASAPAGEKSQLEVLRNNRRLTLPVTIAAQEKKGPRAAIASGEERQALGLTMAPVESGAGVLVTAVAPKSMAAAAGVRRGDLLLAINDVDITDATSFEVALEAVNQARYVRLLLRRGDSILYLAFPAS